MKFDDSYINVCVYTESYNKVKRQTHSPRDQPIPQTYIPCLIASKQIDWHLHTTSLSLYLLPIYVRCVHMFCVCTLLCFVFFFIFHLHQSKAHLISLHIQCCCVFFSFFRFESNELKCINLHFINLITSINIWFRLVPQSVVIFDLDFICRFFVVISIYKSPWCAMCRHDANVNSLKCMAFI